MEIRVLESAKADLRDGWHFYERQSEGLGDYFLASLHADLRSLAIYAGIHESVEGFQRMFAKRFPFAVYYLVESNSVDIYAILDCRRDPDWIVKRIAESRPEQ